MTREVLDISNGEHAVDPSVLTLEQDSRWLALLYGVDEMTQLDVDDINVKLHHFTNLAPEKQTRAGRTEVMYALGVFDPDNTFLKDIYGRICPQVPEPLNTIAIMRLLDAQGIDIITLLGERPIILVRDSSEIEEHLDKLGKRSLEIDKSVASIVLANPDVALGSDAVALGVTEIKNPIIRNAGSAVVKLAGSKNTKLDKKKPARNLSPEAEEYLIRPDIQDRVDRLWSVGIDPRRILRRIPRAKGDGYHLPTVDQINRVVDVFTRAGLSSATLQMYTFAEFSQRQPFSPSGVERRIEHIAQECGLLGIDHTKLINNSSAALIIPELSTKAMHNWSIGLSAAGMSTTRIKQLLENGGLSLTGSDAAQNFDLAVIRLAKDNDSATDSYFMALTKRSSKAVVMVALRTLATRPEGFTLGDLKKLTKRMYDRGMKTADCEAIIQTQEAYYESNARLAPIYREYQTFLVNKYKNQRSGKGDSGTGVTFVTPADPINI